MIAYSKNLVTLLATIIGMTSLANLRGLRGRDKFVYVLEFFARIVAARCVSEVIF